MVKALALAAAPSETERIEFEADVAQQPGLHAAAGRQHEGGKLFAMGPTFVATRLGCPSPPSMKAKLLLVERP
jgi:hypothetical protein